MDTNFERVASAPLVDPTPVVVVGNGPVGQTAALLLARYGLPVVLLDSRDERDPIGSKALCQQRDVLDVWASVGAGDQVAREGTTWHVARTFHRDREVLCHDLVGGAWSPFPPFVNISQSRTEEILDDRIARTELIDVRWRHHVVGLEEDGHGVSVACATGADRSDASEADTHIRGSHVVLAGGSRARHLRRQLGVTFDGRSFSDRFLICDIGADIPDWALERRFYFDPDWNPGRQVLIHPQPGSQFRIDWQVPPEYDLAVDEASGSLDRRIRQIIGDIPYEVVWKSVYSFHERIASRMQVGRVLLAGDMAHIVAPFGARGLNSGVQDAENAAWKLAWVLHGWAGDSLVASYHDERHAAAAENIAITGRTMEFLVPQSEESARARQETLEAAGRDPEATARVDSGRLAEPFWYVASPLTTASGQHPFRGRPPRGHLPPPAPGTMAPDHRLVHEAGRLRALLRGTFSVLAGPSFDTRGLREALASEPMPVAIHEVDELDPSGGLRAALGSTPAEAWLVRPDAHFAAVTDGVEAMVDALARAVGRAVS